MELNDQVDFTRYDLGGAFDNAPLIRGTTTPTFVPERFYRFSSAAEVPLPAGQAGTDQTLTYSIVSAEEGSGAIFSLTGNMLTVTYPETTTGWRAPLVIRAEDSVGNQVDDAFEVSLTTTYAAWRGAVFDAADAADDAISGPMADSNNDGVPNLVSFVQGLSVDDDVRLMVRGPGVLTVTNETVLEMTTPYISGIDFVVETSEDLISWEEIDSTRTETKGVVSITHQFEIDQTALSHPKEFYRIRYSLL